MILNYFHNHVTNGFVEGLNNKLKVIKRGGFGYRNLDHFRLRVLMECGAPRQHTNSQPSLFRNVYGCRIPLVQHGLNSIPVYAARALPLYVQANGLAIVRL